MSMIGYVTKYALTKGILELEGTEVARSRTGERCFSATGRSLFDSYFYGKEWHDNKPGAIARAEEMRKKKIVSLKKQTKRLEVLNFKE